MSAMDSGDRRERDLQRRIQRVYQQALDKSTRNIADFLQVVAKVDSGEKQPPSFYQTDEQKALWRQGFLMQEMQRLHVQELISEEIARAGAKAADIIRETTADIYLDNYGETVRVIEDETAKLGVNVSFAMPKRREVRTVLDESNGVFSKIAYQNMGSNTYIRQKLQAELAQAAILGEDQRKLLKRIQSVTGQSVYQAKRVAQTERNRVQSQARWDAAQEAEKQGVSTYNEWRCRFVRSRDTHMARHGVRVRQGECFPGCNLRYPGDPNGSAAEVINCHCYLQVGVLMPGEELDEDGRIVKSVATQAGQAQNGLQGSAGSGTIRTWDEAYSRRTIAKNSDLSNGIPFKGEPNGIFDKTDDDGNVLQRRVYDADGVAKYDFDTSDHRNPNAHPFGAHKHAFSDGKKNPHGEPLRLTKLELEQNADIIKRGVNYFDD